MAADRSMPGPEDRLDETQTERARRTLGEAITRTQPFQVRVTLDGMRHELIHQYGALTADTVGVIDAAIEEAVRTFDFKAEVQRIIRDLLRAEVDRVTRLRGRTAIQRVKEDYAGDLLAALSLFVDEEYAEQRRSGKKLLR